MPISLVIFLFGILIGSRIKNSTLYRLRLNQNYSEGAVRKSIVAKFKAPNYFLLNNITIPFEDGTTQIDHVLVSTKGIFVIETKHYSGWIFANENCKQPSNHQFNINADFYEMVRWKKILDRIRIT